MGEIIAHGLMLAEKMPGQPSLPAHCPDHFLIRCDGVTALVSAAPENVRSMDADAVASLGLRHHEILQAYCHLGAVLPLRFGSVFSTEGAVRQHIAPRAAPMIRALHHLETHQEYTLRVTLSDDPLPLPQPARTGREFLARGRHLRDLRQSLAERRTALAHTLAETARQSATQIAVAGAPRPDRLLDLVMLLPTTAVVQLVAVVADSRPQAKALGLELSLAGPWPAYSYHLPEPEVCDGA